MKINPIKKILSLALAALLAVGAMPATASAAAGIQKGTPVFTKNSTEVSFAGRGWYVVGDGTSGVSPLPGHLTLLAKTSFGDSEFRRWTGGGYEGNFTYPSDYKDSTLMNYLAAAANALPASEAALITARDLEAPVSAQKLWPLSISEYNEMGTIFDDAFRNTNGYGNYFGLRTPYSVNETCVGVRGGGGYYIHRHVDDPTVSVRPALHLNLAAILFTSSASAKSSATAGSGLIGTSAPGGTLKFTMEDSAQTLKVLATKAQSTQSDTTLSFSYTDAVTGTNQYISCVLADNSGAVKYYGKLADSSSAASGALSVPLSGVVDGTYTLKLFSEQANGDMYTDFAGTSIEMGLSVSSGTGTVNSFGGIVLPSNDASLVGVAGQSISAAGSGTTSAPKTAEITVANSVSAIAEADITAAADASVKLYSDSAFATEESVNLNEGGGNHLYIKVTAQDGTILYYDVTVTRDDDPDIPTVAAAQAKADNAVYNNMTQAAASSETVIVNALKAAAAAAVDDNTVTVTVHSAGLGYQLPTAGNAGNPSGTNGSYTFTVKVSKGVQSQTTAQKAITIIAAPFSPNALNGTATISNPNPRIGDTLVGSLAGDNNTGTLTYVWKAGGSQVGADTSYAAALTDLGKTITLEITSNVETGKVTSAPTAAVAKKAAPPTPNAPTLSSKTHSSVTLTPNTAYEFSKDGTAWQTNNEFTGLTANTAYTFYQRIAATDDTEGSAASIKLDVTTESAPSATLQSIAITTPANKLIYTVGESLDISGMVVTGTYSDSTAKTETVTAANVTGFDSSAPAANQILTVTVGGKTVTYTVTISPAPVISAAISPASANYDLASPADIKTNIAWNSANTVTDVVYAAASMAAPADYTVSGNVLTIKTGYLAAKGFTAGDKADFAISFDKGNPAAFTVDIVYNHIPGGGTYNGGRGYTPAPPASNVVTEKQPDMPTAGKAPVTATAGANGTASASVSDQVITDAISKAQADAKAQGSSSNGIAVELNLSMPQGAASLSVSLSQDALQSLVSAGVTSLTVNGSPVKVTFDLKALQEIQRQSNGTVNISIAPQAKLSASARGMIGTRPVYDLTVGYGSGRTVSGFGGGMATVSVPYTPAKGEAVGALYAVYVDEKGNAARIAGSAYDANSRSIIFTTTHFSLYGVGYTAPSAKFSDISTHWGKDSIDYVVGRGLLSGTSKTTFAPNTAMTRGMLVTALGRLTGVDVKAYTANSFTDVKAGSAFRPYIEWARGKGIVLGIGNGQFAPDRAITREEIAVIFANFAKATGYKLPVTCEAAAYADASDIGSSYAAAVTAMQQAGIMMGENGNRFNPKIGVTRAEASAMLCRYIKLTIDPATAQGWALKDDGQYIYYKDGKALTGAQTIGDVKYFFNPDGTLKTGWVKDGGNWRYYTGNKSVVGWLEIGGKWYYFYADGSLARSTRIDNLEVDENGARKSK